MRRSGALAESDLQAHAFESVSSPTLRLILASIPRIPLTRRGEISESRPKREGKSSEKARMVSALWWFRAADKIAAKPLVVGASRGAEKCRSIL